MCGFLACTYLQTRVYAFVAGSSVLLSANHSRSQPQKKDDGDSVISNIIFAVIGGVVIICVCACVFISWCVIVSNTGKPKPPPVRSVEQVQPIQRTVTPVAVAADVFPSGEMAIAREIGIRHQITVEAALALPPTQQSEIDTLPVAEAGVMPCTTTVDLGALPVAVARVV